MKLTTNQKGILKGIVIAMSVVTGFVAFLYLLSAVFLMPSASAAEKPKWLFLEPPYIFIGLDLERKPRFCIADNYRDFDRTIASNIGIGQKLFRSKNKRHSIDARLTHHSCAFRKDISDYDGLGMQYIWSPWAK